MICACMIGTIYLHSAYKLFTTGALGSSQAYSPLSNRILSKHRHQVYRKQDIRPITIEVHRQIDSLLVAIDSIGLAPAKLRGTKCDWPTVI